ncbi:MAG: APC family permease [Agathobacter sp.]|nr:APC family permease [Agathobacter sp.]MEE1100149.1 APC family permease [Agathobacter sp.]
MDEKKLGLGNVVSVSVGLVIATSCLVSLGSGAGTLGVTFILAMAIAMLLNMTTVASLSELNALMPNTTGGLAQYTLAALGPFPTLISMVGGYIICNTMSCGVEASIFSFSLADTLGLNIPSFVYTLIMTVVILLANLRGVDMFAKIQDIVAFLLVGSLVAMGFIGMIGMGTGVKVDQPYVLEADFKNIAAMTAVAFWLFIGAEYAIPISKEVKNAKRNVPLGMMIGLFLIFIMQSVMVLGFHNYVEWGELSNSAAPHLVYGFAVLGDAGKIWMMLVGALAVISTQNSTVNSLAVICQGMAKMNMLPKIFSKTNKHNVPWFGQVFVSVAILVFGYLSDSSADMISFLILAGSVFWMISYVLAHIDLLVFRKRLPNAPRNFKVPGGIVFPLIGIVGTLYMILNISSDPQERLMIWLLTGGCFIVLGIYSAIWIKVKMKMKVFKSVPLEKVMAMENDLYYYVRKSKGIWK